ncbi:MAG: trehalose-6-phosphate synthase [Candidatus Rokubacteria bacterium]|nr:trehalose-6-phosphate synthase [Candidatus Rokubacteria bacterium]
MEVWNESHLADLLRERLGDAQLVVVSNREPYVHSLEEGQVRCLRPASGLVTALDPVLEAAGGLWVAHGGGAADRKVVDAEGKLAVPPEAPRYTLKRVWLTEEEEAGYYDGLANEALWPLCHIAYVRPVFREADWRHYTQVNRLFARAVLEELDGEACIWLQDYHLGLLPRLLKEARPEARIGHFWHIPWPTPEVFGLAPWRRELLEGLLGADVLGFHIRCHCDNFLDTVARELEAKVDRETSTIVYRGHATRVRPFPIGVDFERITREAEGPAVREEMERLRNRYGLHHELIGLGLDRIDYTKGIAERLAAVERFLQMFPEYRKRIVFCQAGVPSRTRIGRYRALGVRIERMAREINRRHGTPEWQPVCLIREHLSPVQILALYRMAHCLVVSSLHDGMNLVAKEYVAARSDLGGTLLLSRFAGAARELQEALQINPYDVEGMARRLRDALEMPPGERRLRMERLRLTVREQNIYRWAGTMLDALLRLPRKELVG